jgi:anti-anti-sigma regulatory factor
MSLHTALPGEGGLCFTCEAPSEPAPVPGPVTLNLDTDGERLVVTTPASDASGDAGDPLLRQTLSEVLDRVGGGLELDLTDVDRCDCSALSVVLRVRDRGSARTIVLRTSGPAVQRLLALSGVGPASAAEAGEAGDEASPSLEDLAEENAQLHRAMRSRASIDLARGMLMASFHLTAEQSWDVLVTASQHSNTKLHRVAEAVLLTAEGHTLPSPLADHLAAAVQTHGGGRAG